MWHSSFITLLQAVIKNDLWWHAENDPVCSVNCGTQIAQHVITAALWSDLKLPPHGNYNVLLALHDWCFFFPFKGGKGNLKQWKIKIHFESVLPLNIIPMCWKSFMGKKWGRTIVRTFFFICTSEELGMTLSWWLVLYCTENDQSLSHTELICYRLANIQLCNELRQPLQSKALPRCQTPNPSEHPSQQFLFFFG